MQSSRESDPDRHIQLLLALAETFEEELAQLGPVEWWPTPPYTTRYALTVIPDPRYL